MSRFDCLCVGIVVADFICDPIARLPAAGELVPTDRINLAIGGCASNVAVDLAKLGRKSAVAGCVGPDGAGRLISEMLREAGVDTTHLAGAHAAETSATLIVNVRGEDRRFIHSVGANAVFDGSEIGIDVVAQARVLYLGGFGLMARLGGQAATRLFRLAREAGVSTVLDVVLPDSRDRWPELAQVLPYTDVFAPNTDEARLLTGLPDPVQQAEQFLAAGAKTVIVTCGSDGAVLATEAQKLRAKPFRVEFVDGTGSGDAFDAGFIHGMLNGASPERCLELGCALGASCVRKSGATAGVFTASELDAFLSREKLALERIP
ncbi:MAG: carbohydrate kinase family protein [Planctomycetaceae bacterium]